MAKVEVFLLGQFSIMLDGEDILPRLGNSKKKRQLLQYLLINKDSHFSNINLFEHLWASDDTGNPESALKTLVSRLRQDLRPLGISNIIAIQQGTYQWNDSLCEQIDIYRLDELATKVQSYTELNDDAVKEFEEIILLYKGDLLMGLDTDSWIVPKTIFYHTQYLNSVYKYISLLSDDEMYNDVLRVARRALEIDKFDSRLNLELMNALLSLNLKTEAMSHYNYTVDLHYTQLGIKPPDDILNFYKELIKVEHDSNATLNIIFDELEQDDNNSSAYVCDYSIFTDIYRINMRNLQRLNVAILLGVITLSNANSNMNDDLLLLDKVMGLLQETLRNTLRRGDTIARYGPSQFAILLPNANLQTGSLALERAKSAFYKGCSIPNFVLNYKLKPLSLKTPPAPGHEPYTPVPPQPHN